LLGLNRSTRYYVAAKESAENLKLMRLLDEQHLRRPNYGSRSMTIWLQRQQKDVNRKRVRRLMRIMGLEAIYPRPRTSVPNREHRIFPYLLRNVVIDRPDQVWSTDITYVPLRGGFAYLVAIMDWHSRYVLSWQLSNMLDAGFCVEALHDALAINKPGIFNTDQGAQFTSQVFTSVLELADVQISMDGRGRWLDNVFVERLWRSVKYEHLYLFGHATIAAAHAGLTEYFAHYCHERPHQALNNQTPAEVYWAGRRRPRRRRK
jgi:putative transposase